MSNLEYRKIPLHHEEKTGFTQTMNLQKIILIGGLMMYLISIMDNRQTLGTTL